jgi:hypothetical protein
MIPVRPIAPGLDLPVTIFGKNQPEYERLPAYIDPDGIVTSRWKLRWHERLRILLYGDLWLSVMAFGKPLQPLDTVCPIVSVSETAPRDPEAA